MMEGDGVKRQLLELKKELKCWETMFERKHGRKPNREDVDQSPSEIKDTYKQYQRLKSSGTKPEKLNDQLNGTCNTENDATEPGGTTVHDTTDVETFGSYLNKKKPTTVNCQSKEGDKDNKGSMWKLRKWTKGSGYKTVFLDDIKEETKQAHDEEKKEAVLEKKDTSAAVECTEVSAELNVLSQGINIRISQSPQKRSHSMDEVVNVVQNYRPGITVSKRRMGNNLSSNWLQRCKPDLSSLPEVEENEEKDSGESGTDILKDRSAGFDMSKVQAELDNNTTTVTSTMNDGSSVQAFIDDEHFSSDSEKCNNEELEEYLEDDLIEEEEEERAAKEEAKERDSYTSEEENKKEAEEKDSYTSEEDEDQTESGGWDGRLQEDLVTDNNPFDPAMRHGTVCPLPAGNSGYTKPLTITTVSKSLTQEAFPKTATNPKPSLLTSELLQSTPSPSSSISSTLGLLDKKESYITVSTSATAKSTNARKNWKLLEATTRDVPNPNARSSAKKGKETFHKTATNPKPSLLTSELLQSTPCPSSSISSTLGLLDKKESYITVSTSATAKSTNTRRNWKLLEAENVSEPATTRDGISLNPNTRSSAKKGKEKISTTTHKQNNKNEISKSVIQPKISADNIETREPTEYNKASPVFSSNAVSENFVRLNLKVKRYSRKPGSVISGSAYKRKMWKKSQRARGGGGGGGSYGSGRSGGRNGGTNTCFKCGKPGHWAKNCSEREGSKNLGCFGGEKVQFSEYMEMDNDVLDKETLQKLAKDSPFPTTKEASMMARGVSLEQSRQKPTRSEDGDHGSEEIDHDPFQPLPPCRVHSPSQPPPMKPLFSPDQSGIDSEVMSALNILGYQSFRPGQAETTTRILSGISTLLVQPTGSGKSLCYQLPAYLYSQRSSCITLVISPLVSLMEDQVRQFPFCLKGACLHTNQTRSQRTRVMENVAEGKVDVLLLSPEALVSGAFWSGWNKRTLSRLPPVAFACIDEAHCVSEWSHNFRPSYLRVHKVLQERMGVQCILGLTATATLTTSLSVASHLSITEDNIIRGCTVPSNLQITASFDENRDDALLQLLQSSRMQGCDSIIIYCTRQMETERVAQLLRTSLQFFPVQESQPAQTEEEDTTNDAGEDTSACETGTRNRKRTRAKSSRGGKKSKKAKLDWSVDSYHAGMSAGERKKIQLAFMTGRLRIVVATVAFGMGLNKSDVRAIIHYNVPKSFESYVQEIGRAGRDGKPAFCHVFIDKEGADLCELRRHAYSSTVDPYSIKQLVNRVFPKCHCKPPTKGTIDDHESIRNGAPEPLGSSERCCSGHEVSLPIDKTVQMFDTKEECVQTLLCYLELQHWLEMKGVRKDMCTLKCYGGARQLRALAQKVPAVAAATARLQENGVCLDMQSSISFSFIEVASSMGWESHILRSELQDLQFNDRQTTSTSKSSGSSVLVEFSDAAFHLISPGDLSPEELDYVCDYLQKRVKAQETLDVDKLHLLYSVLRSVAFDNIYKYFLDGERTLTQDRLMSLINDYFEDKLDCSTAAEKGIAVLKLPREIPTELEAEISRDVHSLMSIHTERNFSGRTIARIFHGISSPCFPAEVWAKQRRFWRRHLKVDFNVLCQIATRVTLQILHS